MQISLQADEQSLSDRIAGTPSYERKISAARMVKEMDWPLTMNVVVHRHNIDRTGRILDVAEELGRTGSSLPTPSTTGGPGATEPPCFPPGPSWTGPSKSCATPAGA